MGCGPPGASPVPGDLRGSLRGGSHRCGCRRQLRGATGGPCCTVRHLRALRRRDKRRRRRPGESRGPPLYGRPARGVQRRRGSGRPLGGRPPLVRRQLPVRLPRRPRAARDGSPRRDDNPVPYLHRALRRRRKDRTLRALPELPSPARRFRRYPRASLGGGDGALVRHIPAADPRGDRSPRCLGGRGLPRCDGYRTPGSRLDRGSLR